MKQLLLLILLLIAPAVVYAQPAGGSSGAGVAAALATSTFANLGTPPNGRIRYCSNCAATSPCTGGGTGAVATRVNGAWACSTGGGGGGSGDIVGPASSTDNAVARFDGTTGKLIQNSAVIIADTTGNISGPQKITLGTAAAATGSIELNGTTSGTVTVKPADAAGTWTMTLPTSDGDSGQVLQTNGSGVTSWVAAGSSGANTALSNLTAVAINTTLVSDTDNTDDLGTSGIRWKEIWMSGFLHSSATNRVIGETGSTVYVGGIDTGALSLRSGGVDRWSMGAGSGTLLPGVDNTYDLGGTSFSVGNLYIGTALRDTNANELVKFTATASAVNELTITNAATGNAPELSTTGGDATVGLNITTKNQGNVALNARVLTLNSGELRYGFNYGGTWEFPSSMAVSVISAGTTGKIGFGSNGDPANLDAAFYRHAAGVVEVNNGTAGGFGKLLAARVVTAKTGDYTVTDAEKSAFFTNTGAGGGVVFTLPTPVVGQTFEFYRDANQTVTVDVTAGITIRVGASTTTSGGNATLDAVGSRIRIVAISTTQWVGDISGTVTFN